MEKEEMEWKEGKPQPAKNLDESMKTDCELQHGDKMKNAADSSDAGIPAGLEALFNACRNLYPEQPNPLQVTALVKYWLGGPDPLDYISMYEVPANPKLNIPPHWHYVSFGLSDIHGDGRVHEFTGPDQVSGFGFELTMRLKKEPTDKTPPTWPAAVMQGLAKYVFQSESVVCVGDHVSWHSPLDGSESRLQHMLMAADPQLGSVCTHNGRVQFVQVVGITSEELRAAQHWNGIGVLDILKRSGVTGGPWLVMDMRRGESIYEVDPGVADEVEAGIEEHGSNLSGVSAKLSWTSGPNSVAMDGSSCPAESQQRVTAVESALIRTALQEGLHTLPDTSPAHTSGDGGGEKNGAAAPGGGEAAPTDQPLELLSTVFLDSLQISINLESGALLPLALRCSNWPAFE